ncbi:MAG: hypothetical protein IPF50_04725 [Proteobacteria bacterium]|nr:hypothetical protein [Pseudomonadota bacterium]
MPVITQLGERCLTPARIAFGQPAAGDHRTAADAGPAVQVHAVAGLEGVVQHRQDTVHGRAVGRYTVIRNWLAQIVDAPPRRRFERQVPVVARTFIQLGQVDEAGDAGLEEPAQPIHRPGA